MTDTNALFSALRVEQDGLERDDLLNTLESHIERQRIALADAIRRPMGVVPASAEGLITDADLDAAEKRRSRT